jgi:hypothetical protein
MKSILLFFKRVGKMLFRLFMVTLWPIIYAKRKIIYKKSLKYIYVTGLKKLELITDKTSSAIDDKILESYQKKHSKRVLKLIDSMPEENKKIIKDLNKKTGLNLTYSDKNIGIDAGVFKSSFDIKNKKMKFGLNVKL